MNCTTWKKYLLWFAQEHMEFRHSEISSLLSLFNIHIKFVEEPTIIQPYWIVEFKSEDDVKLLASRSVSLRSCIELWAHATTTDALHQQMRSLPEELIKEYFNKDKSFKIDVTTFCKHFSQKEKVAKLETFSYLPVEGPVKLNDPDVTFQYIEYYGTKPHAPPDEPYFVFFGRWVTDGLRQLIKTLSLKTRKFIGNTSMDPQLSLLMANQAKVKDGDLVLDPFVGSGSLLVAAAQFGGYVLGTDIDYLMLHAKTRPSRIREKQRSQDESIVANMKQYNLQHKYLDVLINDFALQFWRDKLEFDSIITDPPYGIREATERIGTSKENCAVSKEHLPTHVPAKIEYGISSIYNDLLKFAAKQLKIDGRLVCWFPVFRENYDEKGLPSHPCLKLISNSEQILSKATSRRLLTFEKLRHPTEDDLQYVGHEITDFREKYFVLREETRQERRMKEAKIREENRIEALKRKKP